MTTLQIDILEPKAQRLLQDLASMNLIRIRQEVEPKAQFKKLLQKIRSTEEPTPTLDEITAEVEAARNERYGKK